MDLEEIRKKIDLIDFQLVKLLNERMELGLRAKKFKETVADESREKAVIQNVGGYPQRLVRKDFAQELFKKIISESKRFQEEDLKLIGFQGEHGANSEVAANTYDLSLVTIPCLEFVNVFEGVEKDYFDLGIVPVENSLVGAVTEVNDLLAETKLTIVAEVKHPIHHCLMTLPDTEYRELKIVYSHPQALAQCRGFIARNKLEPRPYYDTAGAAKMISNSRPKAAAAIANESCAELYNLEIIKENMEDHELNLTRFVILSKQKIGEDGNKCSIIFSTKHEAGALFRVLRIFHEAKINLTRIESRPLRNEPENYAFHLDFEGSDKDAEVGKLLQTVKQNTLMYKFLGCYPEDTSTK
jgi:prephenate dehydratase/chorismate mutase/prephenate dehydratase